MSFILDALKKSETERQRSDAPGLYEVKMAPPRHGVAPWLIVLAGLLVINIMVLSVVLLRGTHGAAPAGDAGTVAAAAPSAPVAEGARQATNSVAATRSVKAINERSACALDSTISIAPNR